MEEVKGKSMTILYETPHWLAVSKPSGLIVENNPFESPTVESLVWDYLSKSNKKPFLGVVHRLDRVTSGVMVFAKKKSALRNLNEQFASRKVKKTYLAVVTTPPATPKGTLQHWLEKDRKDKKAIIFDKPQKSAQSVQLRYRILDQQGSGALMEVQLLTGKFHQIRAQLSAIGCPILGDEKYGAPTFGDPLQIALHAWKLQLNDPQTEALVELKAPPPSNPFWKNFEQSY